MPEAGGRQREISGVGAVGAKTGGGGGARKKNEEIKKRNTDLALVFLPTFVFGIAGSEVSQSTFDILAPGVYAPFTQEKYFEN